MLLTKGRIHEYTYALNDVPVTRTQEEKEVIYSIVFIVKQKKTVLER